MIAQISAVLNRAYGKSMFTPNGGDNECFPFIYTKWFYMHKNEFPRI
jgi:hypothetical protein